MAKPAVGWAWTPARAGERSGCSRRLTSSPRQHSMLHCSKKGDGRAGRLCNRSTRVMDTEHVTPITQPATVTAKEQPASYAADVNALMFAGHALIDGCQAVNAEMLAFWQSRLKDGLATGRRLLECGSAEGAWEIQLDYAKAALQAYVDQSTKITGLVTHAWADSLLPKVAGSAPRRSTGALA